VGDARKPPTRHSEQDKRENSSMLSPPLRHFPLEIEKASNSEKRGEK